MRKPDYAFWTFMTLAAMAGVTTVFNVSRTYSATSWSACAPTTSRSPTTPC
jgi:hypothetical protein